jgi:acyl-CoA synthetase (AMP-forming)/AMP-acid ligase II
MAIRILLFKLLEIYWWDPTLPPAGAVVARPDPMWGETPCAFVTLKPDAAATADEINRLLPRAPRSFQGAADGAVRAAAEDLDRQYPKIRLA